MSSYVIGGANLTQVYALNDDWTLGSEVVTLNQKFTTTISGHKNAKNLEAEISHDQYNEEVTDSLMNTYLIEEDEPDKYEDGSRRIDTSKLLLVIHYSAESNDASPKRHVLAFPCNLKGGGFEYSADTTVKPETKFIGVKAGADITIDSGIFDTDYVTGATGATISKNEWGYDVWLSSS